MNSLVYLLAFLALGFAAQVIALDWVARRYRLERATLWRAVRIVGIKSLAEPPIYFLLRAPGRDENAAMFLAGGIVLVDVSLTLALLWLWFGGSIGRRLRCWGISFVMCGLIGYGLISLLHLVVESYLPTSSSMNPNLRGYHVVESLPDGSTLIVAANDPADRNAPRVGSPSAGIVAETFEHRETPRPATHSHGPDRLLCNKLRDPRRWDAIVFRYPPKPEIIYLKRLIGLPGETVEIRDGAVWIDGVRQSPPVRLGPIRHTYRNLGADCEMKSEPFETTLGPDEYFVLGDNTERAFDSRSWGPVRRDQIIGVGDLIYWPPARWKFDP